MEQTTKKSLGEQELDKLMLAGRLPHGVVLESESEEKLQGVSENIALWAVCTAQQNERPCLLCSNCIKGKTHNHSDIYTAKGSGKTETISVEEIRYICADAYIIPNEAAVKVYVLPAADKMQASAQNAFLKVLEEPVQNILFILLCKSAEGLLATVRSRTVTFKLDTDEAQSDTTTEEAKEIAGQMAEALLLSKGYALLVQTGKLTDRAFAKQVLACFASIIRDALVLRLGMNIDENGHTKTLSKKIKTANLIELLNTIQQAQQKLDRNVNMNLFSTWLCSELRRKK